MNESARQLSLSLDGIGPGYAFEQNSLRSGLEVFLSDGAVEGPGADVVEPLLHGLRPRGEP